MWWYILLNFIVLYSDYGFSLQQPENKEDEIRAQEQMKTGADETSWAESTVYHGTLMPHELASAMVNAHENIIQERVDNGLL
jgi:hypothetical protein